MMSLFQKLFLCLICLPFVLGGCRYFPALETRDPQPVFDDSQAPRSSGRTETLSPEEQHARARALVDPTQSVQHNAYVKNVEDMEPSPAKGQQNTRLEQTEQTLDVVQKEFKGLKDSVKKAQIAPAAGNDGFVHVQALRLGEYPDKTRLVLDMDGPADFRFEVDNAEKLLVISLPDAQWNAPGEYVYKRSKMLKAYAAKSSKTGGGAVVVMKLTGPAKILRSEKLGQNAEGMHRIFLDISPL